MKKPVLLAFGLCGCGFDQSQRSGEAFGGNEVPPSSHGLARIAPTASRQERGMFMQAIRDARILEIDLPPRLERTPFAIPYFQMSEVAIEAFYIVAQEPGMRSHWVALAKVCASGDGEYAGPYLDCEKAAKARFPEVFFRACPDWNELVLSASRASAGRTAEYDGAR